MLFHDKFRNLAHDAVTHSFSPRALCFFSACILFCIFVPQPSLKPFSQSNRPFSKVHAVFALSLRFRAYPQPFLMRCGGYVRSSSFFLREAKGSSACAKGQQIPSIPSCIRMPSEAFAVSSPLSMPKHAPAVSRYRQISAMQHNQPFPPVHAGSKAPKECTLHLASLHYTVHNPSLCHMREALSPYRLPRPQRSPLYLPLENANSNNRISLQALCRNR